MLYNGDTFYGERALTVREGEVIPIDYKLNEIGTETVSIGNAMQCIRTRRDIQRTHGSLHSIVDASTRH